MRESPGGGAVGQMGKTAKTTGGTGVALGTTRPRLEWSRNAWSRIETLRRRRPRLVAGIAAGVVVALVVIIALVGRAPLTGPSAAGTWVGDHQTARSDDTLGAVYLDLHQDGDKVTGSERVCVNRGGAHSAAIAVSGQVKGDVLTLTYDYSPAGIPLGVGPVTLTGRLGGTLALTSTALLTGVTLHLQKGDTGAFDALYAHLPAAHG